MAEVGSTITCPRCGHTETETMPTNACQFFCDCKGYGVLLQPKPGDCCVFCSYGSVPCPPARRSPAGRTWEVVPKLACIHVGPAGPSADLRCDTLL